MACNFSGVDDELEICDKDSLGGLLIPSTFGIKYIDDRPSLRAVIYLMILLWTFIGVQIVADVFMSAIEKITSKRKACKTEQGNYHTAEVWNPTVANLTLMALGSSAPEILLNVVAVWPNFKSSELGPSTIVGSAAFNLLVIIGVCIVSIPSGGVRKIANLGVYSVTATASIFAYVWLLVIVSWNSPDAIEAWEGVATFLFFWILIVVAYLLDKRSGDPGLEYTKGASEKQVWQMELEMRRKYGTDRLLTKEETELLMAFEFPEKHSRAVHRSQAINKWTAARMRFPSTGRTIFMEGEELANWLLSIEGCTDEVELVELAEIVALDSKMVPVHFPSKRSTLVQARLPVVEFAQRVHTVLESAFRFNVMLVVWGEVTEPIEVPWATRADTADENDFVEDSGVVRFTPGGAQEATIVLEIKPRADHCDTKHFHAFLLHQGLKNARLGALDETTITIIDQGAMMDTASVPESATSSSPLQNRPAGFLRFEEEVVSVKNKLEDSELVVKVLRAGGDYGKVSCRYFCESDSAVAGKDFNAVQGVLEFDHLEAEKELTITILGCAWPEDEEVFRVILEQSRGGASFDPQTDGGRERCILTVTIGGTRLSSMLNWNWHIVEVGTQSWKEHLIDACRVNGSEGESGKGDPEPVTCMDRIMHLVAVVWKVLGALIPPPDFCDGWLTFFVALLVIGLITVVIGDLAKLLGCVWNLPDSVTAITLVALGTSLPDTFASRSAAMWEPTADSCIGNVTGSNSVNVFLGLGLPWTISSMYWRLARCGPEDDWTTLYRHSVPDVVERFPRGVFVVQRGNLEASVFTFSIVGVLCILGLALRRAFVGGELGGPKLIAWASSVCLFLLWIIYIAISSAVALGWRTSAATALSFALV